MAWEEQANAGGLGRRLFGRHRTRVAYASPAPYLPSPARCVPTMYGACPNQECPFGVLGTGDDGMGNTLYYCYSMDCNTQSSVGGMTFLEEPLLECDSDVNGQCRYCRPFSDGSSPWPSPQTYAATAPPSQAEASSVRHQFGRDNGIGAAGVGAGASPDLVGLAGWRLPRRLRLRIRPGFSAPRRRLFKIQDQSGAWIRVETFRVVGRFVWPGQPPWDHTFGLGHQVAGPPAATDPVLSGLPIGPFAFRGHEAGVSYYYVVTQARLM